jgi:hemerythrin-like metal-binding protein
MDAASACTLAQEVSRSVEALALPHERSPFGRITFSIGLAVMTHEHPKDVASLLRGADEALYLAKRNGRNQVRLAEPTRLQAHAVPKIAAHLVQLVWHPSYSCGLPEIDDHHRSLFAQINTLLAAIMGQSPPHKVTALIDTLISHVTHHFEEEEKLLQQTGFPQAQAHAAQHRELLDHAAYLVDRFKSRDLDIAELFQFLASELVAQHMLGADRAFFNHLNPLQLLPQE